MPACTLQQTGTAIHMTILLSLTIILAVITTACNPVRRIDMMNATNDTVRFIWTLNEDSLSNNPFLLSNAKELEFTLVPAKNKVVKMSFGAGNWSREEVNKLAGFLESLEIHSAAQRIKIDSLAQLKEFLFARRKGLGAVRIEIVVLQ